MTDKDIVFFDLPSRPPRKAWSFNPWKTRFTLNYKGLPYKTEWIEYPDLKPTFQEHFPDKTEFTIPTIIMPDGTWVMDSWKIADLLEEKYPEPSLHLDSEYIPRLKKLLPGAIMALRSIYAPGVYNNVLSPASEEFFRRTREENFGKTLEEVAKDGGEPAWKAAEPNLQKITALLEENTEGPFFDGKTVGFADFVWAGYLIFFGRIGEDVFDRALKASGNASTHLKLLEALKPWTERDDH